MLGRRLRGYGASHRRRLEVGVLLEGRQVAHWVRNAEATTDGALYKTPYVDGLLDPYRLYIMETRP